MDPYIHIKQCNSYNNKYNKNNHIIMISEGLCDTENTENYAEHSWCFASWRLHRNVC